jgi:hypothetical protein
MFKFTPDTPQDQHLSNVARALKHDIKNNSDPEADRQCPPSHANGLDFNMNV